MKLLHPDTNLHGAKNAIRNIEERISLHSLSLSLSLSPKKKKKTLKPQNQKCGLPRQDTTAGRDDEARLVCRWPNQGFDFIGQN
jgi:hypothetical protein